MDQQGFFASKERPGWKVSVVYKSVLLGNTDPALTPGGKGYGYSPIYRESDT